MLNIDGGGGVLDEKTGAPEYFTWQGAEKTYADFQLTVTNPRRPLLAAAQGQCDRPARRRPGPHRPIPVHARAQRPDPRLFRQAARFEDPEIGAAMRAFVADPTDKAAIATLAANPATVGKIGTTCVVTMISGGHALNALPQRATANINCRIFPGHKPAEIMAQLQAVAAEPTVSFKDVSEGSVVT
ncbi:MAG: peptidase dimerization domain-containing protein, partial [Caulobacteraceae bacterium]